MKRNSLLVACLCCLPAVPCAAQEPKPPPETRLSKMNTFGAELGGPGLYGSVFYERGLWQKNHTRFSLALGAGPKPYTGYSEQIRTWRLGYSAYLSPKLIFYKKRHAWDAGAALTFCQSPRDNWGYNFLEEQETYRNVSWLFAAAQAGYRYYFSNNRWYFRASLQVLAHISTWSDQGDVDVRGARVIPWGSVGLGFNI